MGRAVCGKTEEFCTALAYFSGSAAVGIRGHNGENNRKLGPGTGVTGKI